MARSKLHDRSKEDAKSRRGPPSYPYVVYASWCPPGGELRWLILKFKEPWGARNMINSLTHNLFGGGYELKTAQSMGWHYMQFENGMKVSLRDNDAYREVMELDFDEAESYVSDEVRYFKYGSSFEGVKRTGDTPPSNEQSDDNGRGDRKAHKKIRDGSGPARDPKVPRQKVDKSGKVSANDIAEELGVEGRVVRGILRGMNLTKPAGGWLFEEALADDIRAKVKSGLKKK